MGYRAQLTIGDDMCATMSDMNSIGQRMKSAAHGKWGDEWRVELRRATGFTRQTLHKIENGDTKNPQPATLFAIADAIGIEARWLGTGEGSRTAHLHLTDEERRWLALRDQLDPEQQHTLRRFLDALGERPSETAS